MPESQENGKRLRAAHPGRHSVVERLPFGHEGQARPEKSLVWVPIFVKTSLCADKALVTVGLSLTAARPVKMTAGFRREMGSLELEGMCSAFMSGAWSAVS